MRVPASRVGRRAYLRLRYRYVRKREDCHVLRADVVAFGGTTFVACFLGTGTNQRGGSLDPWRSGASQSDARRHGWGERRTPARAGGGQHPATRAPRRGVCRHSAFRGVLARRHGGGPRGPLLAPSGSRERVPGDNHRERALRGDAWRRADRRHAPAVSNRRGRGQRAGARSVLPQPHPRRAGRDARRETLRDSRAAQAAVAGRTEDGPLGGDGRVPGRRPRAENARGRWRGSGAGHRERRNRRGSDESLDESFARRRRRDGGRASRASRASRRRDTNERFVHA